MARATPEQINAERVAVPFELPVEHVATDSKVFVEYSSNQRGNAPFAREDEFELTAVPGDDQYTGSREFDPNTQIRYKIRIEEPDELPRHVVRNVARGYDVKNAVAAPEPSPSSTTPTGEVNARIKAQVTSILDALKTHEGAQGADDLVDNLLTELDDMNIKGDQRKLIVRNVCAAVIEMDNVPNSVKASLKIKPEPEKFDELKERLKKGGKSFMDKVFRSIKADPKSRKAFNLKSDSRITDLKGHELATFTKICNQYFPSEDGVAYLGAAMESVSKKIPENDQALTAERHDLLKKVVARLTPHEKNDFWSRVPPNRRGALFDVGSHALMGGALAVGAAPVAGLAWIGKSAAETLTGISSSDVMKRDADLWRLFKENNIVSRMLTTQDTVGSVLKSRTGEFFKRLVPFWKAGKQVGEGGSHAAVGEHGEGEHHDIDELIRNACQKEVGTGGGGH